MSRRSVAQQLRKKFSLGLRPATNCDDEQTNADSKGVTRLRSPTKSHHLAVYSHVFMEYSIMAEYNNIRKQRIPGVFVIPSQETSLDWFGVIVVNGGMYNSGIFRFLMTIPHTYPDGDAPSVVFSPPIFHPAVDSCTGKLDVGAAFPVWRANINHLYHVLLYVRRIFYKLDFAAPKNVSAGALLKKNPEHFKRAVQDTITGTREKLYDSSSDTDGHSLRFPVWDDSVYSKAMSGILERQPPQPKDELCLQGDHLPYQDISQTKLSGLSWLEPGTFLILTKQSLDVE